MIPALSKSRSAAGPPTTAGVALLSEARRHSHRDPRLYRLNNRNFAALITLIATFLARDPRQTSAGVWLLPRHNRVVDRSSLLLFRIGKADAALIDIGLPVDSKNNRALVGVVLVEGIGFSPNALPGAAYAVVKPPGGEPSG